MVFTRQKARAGANPEYPPQTQPVTNICEVGTPSWTFFTREHNELFIQWVLQYSQDVKGDELHFFVICLNESSTDKDMNKAYYSLDHQFHPDKNQHSHITDVMQRINEAKE